MEEAAGTTTGETSSQMRTVIGDRPWIVVLAGVVLALLLLLIWSTAVPDSFTALFDSLDSTDIEQGRIDTALPAPQGDLALTQSFAPRHNGLNEVEITLLRYGEPSAGESAQLWLRLFNEQGETVAEKAFPTATVNHNQVVRLSFPPQADSKGRPYTLQLSGTPDNQVSAWAYSLDAYSDGNLAQTGDVNPIGAQDLRFQTRYRLTWSDALSNVGETIFYEGLILLLALLVDLRVRAKFTRALLVGLFFFFAALSKEMAVALALVLPFWYLARSPERPLGRAWWKRAWRQGDVFSFLAVVAGGLLYLLVRYASLGYLVVRNVQETIPAGTVLRDAVAETHQGDVTFLRQRGSYPIVIGVRRRLPLGERFDVRVTGHMRRSVTAELLT